MQKLQSKVPSRPTHETHSTLLQELGVSTSRSTCLRRCRARLWLPEVPDPFESFEWQPLATASIAQVHRAQLKDGRLVAVKIQHQWASAAFDFDAKLAKEFVDRLAKEKPTLDFRGVFEDLCTETLRELNFVEEAGASRAIASCLKSALGDSIYVPEIILHPPCLAPSRKKLVMEFIDGFHATEVGSSASNTWMMEDLMRAFSEQIFLHGHFHADPHPGNILFERQYRKPALLDFGLTRYVCLETRMLLARLVVFITDNDVLALQKVAEKIGLPNAWIRDPNSLQDRIRTLLAASSLRVEQETSRAETEVVADVYGIREPDEEMTVVTDCATVDEPASEPSLSDGGDHTLQDQPASEPDLDASELGSPKQGSALDLDYVAHNMQRIPSRQATSTLISSSTDSKISSFFLFIRVITSLRSVAYELGVSFNFLEAMYPIAKSTLRRHIAASFADPLSCTTLQCAEESFSSRLQTILADLISRQEALGVSVCIYVKGSLLGTCSVGQGGLLSDQHIDDLSLFPAFGCGNILPAMLTHVLADTGQLKLEDRFGEYWQQFDRPCFQNMTIRDVLEHRGGMSAFCGRTRGYDSSVEEACRWDLMLQRIGVTRPTEEPLGSGRYHRLSFGWMLGGLVQKISRLSYPALLLEQVVTPLKLEEHVFTLLRPPFEEKASGRLASTSLRDSQASVERSKERKKTTPKICSHNSIPCASIDPLTANDPEVIRSLLPSFNVRATSFGLATLMGALASDGSVVGRGRVLSETYCRWMQDEIANVGRGSTTEMPPELANRKWPLGFRCFPQRHREGVIREAFGYAGMNSCIVACDPKSEVALCILVNELSVRCQVPEAVLTLLYHYFPHLGRFSFDGFRDDTCCFGST